MRPTTAITTKITPLLEETASYLEQLFQALLNENKALADDNIQAVQEIAQEKVLLMEQLEDLNKERRSLLETAGLDLSATGIDDFFSNNSITKSSGLSALWKTIATLSKQCEKQNNINGIVIENNKRRTESALSILQGKQQTTELYSNKGQSIKMSGKQTLIRA